MKLHRWISCTILLARSLPVFCIGSYRQNSQSSNTTHCENQDMESHALKGGQASTTAHSVSAYLQHSVQRLKDLGSIHEPMDVVVAGLQHDAKEHVIFFGGDVQDYPENMKSHRDNGKYVHWNILATAEKLSKRFPTAMVLVIKPHHMHLKTFSVYSQFVQSNDFGCPTHTADFDAWHTLIEVYTEAVETVLRSAIDTASNINGLENVGSERNSHATKCSSENPSAGSGDSDSCTSSEAQLATQSGAQSKSKDVPLSEDRAAYTEVPVHLIGFSKGCIVLNQLLHELEAMEYDDKVQHFISQIHRMTWLDGGHSGGSNTWVTDPAILKRLAATHIEIIVHVTPYQVKDSMRRWIGKEKCQFVELLQKAGAKVTDTLHFEDEPKSIENHFKVLDVF